MSPDGWSWSVKPRVWLQREQKVRVKVESPRPEQASLRGEICIGYRVGIGFFFVGRKQEQGDGYSGCKMWRKNKKVEREAKQGPRLLGC